MNSDTNINTESPPHKSHLQYGAVLGLVVIVLAAAFFYSQTVFGREHLIPGVPYEGSYNVTEITTGTAAAAYSILQYWGDDRFTTGEIADIAPYQTANIPEVSYTDTIVNFFRENGYRVESRLINDNAELRKIIDSNIPAILSQRVALEVPQFVVVTRLLIGYSDERKTFIFHDNNFGNNYLISYADFDALNEGYAKRVILVTPEESLKPQLRGPDPTFEYPSRLGIMDSPNIHRIQIKWVTIDALRLRYARGQTENPAPEMVELWKQILADPGFDELHPGARRIASYNLAGVLLNELNNYDEAIAVLEDVTIPLLAYDFSQPFGEWDATNRPEIYDNPQWYSAPWARLGVAYARNDEKEKALNAFEKALEFEPDNEYMQRLHDIVDSS